MRATVSALLALFMLAAPLAGVTLAQDDERLPAERDLQVVVETGATDRFGGGEWVSVRVGDTRFAVMYGNETNANSPKVLVDYVRYLGKAEIYDQNGQLLRNGSLPVRTVMAQSFDFMFEFSDGNGDGLFQVPSLDDFRSGTQDTPRKALDLRTAWTLEDLRQADEGNVTTVDFNLTARNLTYAWVLSGDDAGDGMLNRVTLAFHLRVDRVVKTVDVNVYRIVVDTENRTLLERGLDRTETVTGLAVDGSFKYDHYIEGWDWAADDSRLALVTHVLVGNLVPDRVSRFLHLAFISEARTDGTRYHENDTIERPQLITADEMSFEDDWDRVGRIEWVSHVEVDGETTTMSFQLHKVETRASFDLGFRGVLFWGAFIYPKGEVIFHDPSLAASAFIPVAVEDALGLGPYFLQMGLVSLAVVGLVLYRVARGKRA